MSAPLKTALNSLHRRLAARMVDFAGWDMPVQYGTGIVAEHTAVRTSCGLFDLSHMGRVYVRGAGAMALAQRCLTRDLSRIAPGQAAYGLLCDEQGGILDDVIAYVMANAEVLFVFNASNREKDVDWLERQRAERGLDATVEDRTFETALLGLQGPDAQRLLQPLCSIDLEAMPGYAFAPALADGRQALVARTGYTGEDGFELLVGAAEAQALWERLSAAGAAPCGLGARDTLRTEAGMPLYGHEIDQSTNPYEAGLGWTVSVAKEDFAGREALVRLRQAEPARRLAGLLVDDGGGVPRPGFSILGGGVLTSGTFSPTLKRNIALGYVPAAKAAPGTRVQIEIRGRGVGATVATLPFVPHRTRPRQVT